MEIKTGLLEGRPSDKRIAQEEAIYDRLGQLNIRYFRVDHEHANTMEDCLEIEKGLNAPICENLFLCNRQQTDFYMLLMPGSKPFKTKYLSSQPGCARLSFADESKMCECLKTIPGSVSALELIFDTENKVRLLIDEDLLKDEFISGHPGISTSTVRLKREDMLEYIEKSGHSPILIQLPWEIE